jgi:hypothetical protein
MITKDQVEKLARKADRGYEVNPDHEASIVGDEAIQKLAQLVYRAAIDDAVRECERLKAEAATGAFKNAYYHASATIARLRGSFLT